MLKRIQLSGLQSSLGVLLISGLIATASATLTAAPPANSPAKQATLRDNYAKLPLSFEANQGQTNKRVKFLSRGNGYELFLTGQEAVLALTKIVSTSSPARTSSKLSVNGITPTVTGNAIPKVRPLNNDAESEGLKGHTHFTTDVVRMQLAGANMSARPEGIEKLPGTSNYFLGNDSTKWRAGVPNYSKVRYASVYPGVDLVYYGNQRQLEYDFVVAPEADPRPIRLHFAGAKKLKLDSNGNLAIAAENGSIAFHKPVVYQTVNGARRPVSGVFLLLADNSVGFSLGRYDHSKPLVIDPILAYSTYFGGTNAEFVVAVAADASGDAYVTGLTISEDFPLTAGAFQAVDYATPANAVSTAFISKFNPSGTALLYSTYLGGVAIADTLHEQGDYGKAIAVDASGDAYITGYTYSSDFPVTSGAFQKGNQAANNGLATGFVTKLNPSGTGLLYSTYLGGSTLDELTALAIDSSGNAYISGISFSADFPTTTGVFQTTNKSAAINGYSSVVSKLNPTGSALIYSTYLGGSLNYGTNLGNIYWTNPIAVDSSGDAYVAGFTQSGDFPITTGAFQTTNHGGFNITVSKLNPTATKLLYSTYLGGSTNSISEGMAIDSSGNVYVAGYTSDTDFPVTTGAFQTVNHADTNTTYSEESNQNGFVTKLNSTGTKLVYSTYLGGTTGPWGGDQIYRLALDSSNDVYVAGSAMSADFPVTVNAYQSKNKGATHCCDYTAYTSDGFLTELNPAGTALIYSSYLGGSGTQNPVGPGGSGDTAYGLALGKNGNVYVVGFTTSPNFPVTKGAFETKYDTQQNTGFVANFNLGTAPTTGDTVTTLTPSANSVVPGTSVTFTAVAAPVSGTGIPTGNIVFSVDEATVATVTLSGGKATYTTSSLVAGEHYVLASYAGNTTYAASGDGLNEIISPVKPVITPAAGTYTSQQTVTITAPTASSVIYYTADGSAPSIFSTEYSSPLVVNFSKTISAVAIAEHDADSSEATAAYTIIGSPSVLGGPASAISTTGATLNAFVNTSGLAGSYYFVYGTSATALTTSTAKTALGASSTRVQAAAKLTTLTTKTKYYYQVVVSTAGGSAASGILSFTTN
jgi:hypothetical protein